MSNAAITLSEQVDRLVTENQSLRVKSSNDDAHIHLLTEQYAAIASQVASIRRRATEEVTRTKAEAEAAVMDMQIERDQAVAAFKAIDTTLLQAAELIMQAARARVGDAEPAAPVASINGFDDARLPATRLS